MQYRNFKQPKDSYMLICQNGSQMSEVIYPFKLDGPLDVRRPIVDRADLKDFIKTHILCRFDHIMVVKVCDIIDVELKSVI